MPKLDTYGSQPPIELLRQFQDFRGMYDREKFFWKEFQVTDNSRTGFQSSFTSAFILHTQLLYIRCADISK